MDKLQTCPLCHEVDTRDEFPAATGPARRFPVVRCAGCELVFQKFVPSDEQLEDGQRGAYGAPARRFHPAVEAVVRVSRWSRVRLAARLLPPGGRVLDVGCGRGVFLHMLQRRGYRVRGTELSQATAANAMPGVPVDAGELRVGQYPDNHFDLVSIWHVLEHLRAPDVTLQACWRALRPGGSLLIAVPNYASAQAQLGGERWFHLDLPRHLFHFTPTTLGNLLRDGRFVLDRLRTGQWEMDPFGLLQSVLNRAGLRHNGLYDVLRNTPECRRDLSPLARAGLLALFPVGMLAATGASAVLRVLDRSGSLIAIAHKPADV